MRIRSVNTLCTSTPRQSTPRRLPVPPASRPPTRTHVPECTGSWVVAPQCGWARMAPCRRVFFLSAPLLGGSSLYLAQKERAVAAHGQRKCPLLLQEPH